LSHFAIFIFNGGMEQEDERGGIRSHCKKVEEDEDEAEEEERRNEVMHIL